MKQIGPKMNSLSTAQYISQSSESIYQIELTKFQINNQKQSPIQTTKGINDAIRWAKTNGYTAALLPGGNYLIDRDSSINLIGDFTFYMTDLTMLYKESNNSEHYDVIKVDYPNNNVTIIGGKIVGDKDTHDYSSGGTHEWGFGIHVTGARNIQIKNVELWNFTGDGILLSGQNNTQYVADSTKFKNGDIDDTGKLITSTKKLVVSNDQLILDTLPFKQTNEILVYPSHIDSLSNQKYYSIYFYDTNKNFISFQKNVLFLQDPVKIPVNAKYYKLTFDGTSIPPDLMVDVWAFYFADTISIDNCHIHDNRRQGISVVGGRNVTTTNCTIHDIKGTAPQSGIDVEGGDYPNNSISISNNRFYNNESYDLIFYDGKNLTATANYFGSKGKVGFTSNPIAGSQIVSANTFDGCSAYVDGTTFSNNTINSTRIYAMRGANVIGNTFNNSRLELSDASVVIKGDTFTNTDQSSGWNIYTTALYFTVSDSKFVGNPGATLIGGAKTGITFMNSEFVDIGHDINLSNATNCKFTNNNPSNPMTVLLMDTASVTQSTFTNTSVIIDQVTNVATNKTISNSSFLFSKIPNNLPIITVKSALKFTFSNNKMDLKLAPNPSYQLMKFYKTNNSYSVKDATVSGNTFTVNSTCIAADTFDYNGYSKPFYFTNNTLNKCIFKLKPNDVSSNNTIIK